MRERGGVLHIFNKERRRRELNKWFLEVESLGHFKNHPKGQGGRMLFDIGRNNQSFFDKWFLM
jgi:hypothetical protein